MVQIELAKPIFEYLAWSLAALQTLLKRNVQRAVGNLVNAWTLLLFDAYVFAQIA